MAPWSRLTSPIYKNTGSVARDHLASERTYLAWTRTGLGFVALGMGVERFSRFEAVALGNNNSSSSSSSSSSSKPQTTDEQQKQKGGGHGEALGSRLLVGTLLTLGTGCMVYATKRYFSVLRSLEKGEFRPAYQGIAAMGAVLGALGGGVSTRMTGAWFESDESSAKE